VLNDHDGVPSVHETVKRVNETFHIRHVKPHSRLIQNVEGLSALPSLGELGHELDALRFATRERGTGLAKP